MLRRTRRGSIAVVMRRLLPFILLGMMLNIAGCDPARSGEMNKANAQKIITALKKHKQDTGRYPPALSSLVPKYLAELPKAEDAKWFYVSKGTECQFGFDGNSP